MLRIIQESKNPEVLILTPLLTGHKISRETRNTIRRNNIPFVWASYEGDGKHADNVQKGLECYISNHKNPPYFQIIDNDIILGRGMIDKLYNRLRKTPKEIAFAFCPFSYKGYINVDFPARNYDINDIMRNNYISSNSLYKMDAILDVGGFVTELKYHRLSDWCMWLKFYIHKYYGVVVENTSFVAISANTNISAGSIDEFEICKREVIKDFILPIIKIGEK
jgi:hypothetical protein